jgi:hypothetical protein
MPSIVAYLDALGYSNYTREDLAGAVQLLSDQQRLLKQKISDGLHHPAQSHTDPTLAAFAAARHVDSFRLFLPFSDSTFIASERPDDFLPQLAHFLISSFEYTGHAFRNGTEGSRPEEVQVKVFGGGASVTTETEHWYPSMWRGGLGEGTLHVSEATALLDGKAIQVPNLSGTAVVNAARAEGGGRGPRLFCAPDFSRHFGAHLQHYFRGVDANYSEFLWPAFSYGDGNPSGEINCFSELWFPAVGLWRSKKNTGAFEHYNEFLKLLIRSCLTWAKNAGYETEATAFVRRRVQDDLGADLLDLEPLAMGVLP